MAQNMHLVPYMKGIYDSIASSRKLRGKEIESFPAWLDGVNLKAADAAEKAGAIPAIHSVDDMVAALNYVSIGE